MEEGCEHIFDTLLSCIVSVRSYDNQAGTNSSRNQIVVGGTLAAGGASITNHISSNPSPRVVRNMNYELSHVNRESRIMVCL